EGGREDDLGEGVVQGGRHGGGDRAVARDDAAVGRDRVARVGALVRGLDGVTDGDATGVGVLDDRDGRPVAVVVGGTQGGVGVDVVVVGHLLAVELVGPRQTGPGIGDVEGRPLVRVLAVAQHLPARPRAADLRV